MTDFEVRSLGTAVTPPLCPCIPANALARYGPRGVPHGWLAHSDDQNKFFALDLLQAAFTLQIVALDRPRFVCSPVRDGALAIGENEDDDLHV